MSVEANDPREALLVLCLGRSASSAEPSCLPVRARTQTGVSAAGGRILVPCFD
jgi:hypothetical protein